MAKKPRRQKHVPQRTCVICRDKTDKRDLTRIVKTADEGVLTDPTGKRNGRGAYICNKQSCWEKASSTTVLANALKTTLTENDKTRIQNAASEVIGNERLHE